MTCRNALALLEDYIDGNLAGPQTASFNEHIDRCDSCREEYESSVLLRGLLKRRTAPDPGPDYWRETSSLIRARTVESEPQKIVTLSVTRRADAQRGAFVRAVLSVAASLVVLFSAILLGSSRPERLARMNSHQPPFLASATVVDRVETDINLTQVESDNIQLARGMLLVGAPGTLGRFIAPLDISYVSR